MRIPLFLASAAGMAQQILDGIEALEYQPNEQGHPRLLVQGKPFLLYRIRLPHPTQEGAIVSNFTLPVQSEGTDGKWSLWILYPEEPLRATAKDAYDRVKAWVAANAAGYLLGPYTPAKAKTSLPAVLSDAIFAGGSLPHVIAGDSGAVQALLDDVDLEEPT